MDRVVVVLDRARDDLEAARDFYEVCEVGAGDYFVESLLADIEGLQFYCGLNRIHFGFHRQLSKRFPFAIYYNLIDEVVSVVAILDMRMHPSKIRSMVLDRSV